MSCPSSSAEIGVHNPKAAVDPPDVFFLNVNQPKLFCPMFKLLPGRFRDASGLPPFLQKTVFGFPVHFGEQPIAHGFPYSVIRSHVVFDILRA